MSLRMNDPHESFDAELDGFPVASDAEHLEAASRSKSW